MATLEGASTTTTAALAPDAGEAGLEEALLAFTACMREEGIDLPDPEPDAAGNLKLVSFMADAGAAAAAAGGTEALRDAATACRHHLTGVALRFASIDRTEMQDRLLAYADCMREHGYDLPDPDFSGAGPGMRAPSPASAWARSTTRPFKRPMNHARGSSPAWFPRETSQRRADEAGVPRPCLRG